MQTYAQFSPTPFDCRGAFLADDRAEWLVLPVSVTRDSGPFAKSNFATATALLSAVDVDGADHENHRFGHWGPGWFEILIVRPGSAAAVVAADIETRLADYPLLDEDDAGEREWESAQECWSNMSVRDRVEVIQERGRGGSIFAARRPEIPADDNGSIYDYCREDG
jgi:hypothetical protein